MCRTAILTLLACLSFVTNASNIIEEVSYAENGSPAVIEISFVTPMQYLSHVPKDKSEFIEVFMKMRDAEAARQLGGEPNHTLKAPERSSIPLTSVGMEMLRDGNVKVTVLFSEAVRFLVSQGSDPKRLLITLPDIAYVHVPSEKSLQRTMDKARKSLQNGDNANAINLYMGVLSLPDNVMQQEALEYLGIARERNGQTAQAKNVYEQYLEKYKEGAGHDRVKQRLAELLTDQFAPRPPLPTRERKKTDLSETEFYGSFNQYFNYAENNIANLPRRDNIELSQVLTSIDVNSRIRRGSEEWRFLVYADETHDINHSESEPVDINSLYGSYRNRGTGTRASVGRQTSRSGGISGRFDGVFVSREFNKRFGMELSAGYPVLLTDKQHIQTQKPTIGGGMTFSNVLGRFDIKPYGVVQRNHNVLNRAALGTELNYFDEAGFAYTLLDYDVKFRELNIFYNQGQYKFKNDLIASVVLDIRKSPSLEMENALINEFRVSQFDDLVELIGSAQAREQASKRTGTSYLLSVGLNKDINQHVQIGADVSRSDQVYRIPNDDAITYASFHDRQYDFATQLILVNLTDYKDTTLLDMRYSDTDLFHVWSWSARYRFSFAKNYQLDIRAWRSNRSRDDGQQSTVTRPSLKVTYQTKRRFRAELEFGREWNESSASSPNEDYERYFVNFVYRLVY